MIMVPVIAVLWGRIYHPVFGMLNHVLRLVGLGSLTRAWLGESKIALYSIIIMFIWQNCGWPMILFLAAMSNIPETIHDAARIDGTSSWQRVWFITIPMIKYVIAIVTILQIIWSLKVFTAIWIMTQGGPGYATEVFSIYLYYIAFYAFRMGYASTISVVASVFILVITIIYIKLFGAPTYEY